LHILDIESADFTTEAEGANGGGSILRTGEADDM